MHRSAKLLAIGIIVAAILSCGAGSVSPSADFTVNSFPSSVTIQAGHNIINIFSINPENGFNGRITLTVTGIPEGLTFGPTPSQVTGPGTYTTTWSAAPDLALGNYTITFLFTSGRLQHSYNVVAQVQ
ncbi:MAG: hypothetical protein ACLPLR_13940 [Terriglobales bacterium]